MKVIVTVHHVERPHAVSDTTLRATVEDPKGREDLTARDSQRIFRYLKDATLRMGPGVSLVAADSGAETGRALIIRAEIEQMPEPIDDAVQRISQLAHEAFMRAL